MRSRQHLSDLTGDPEYGELAQRAESNWFADQEASSSEFYPGLTSGNFSVATGEQLDPYGGWTSGNDSAWEYLIKMYVYDPERYENYSQRWQAAADSTIAHFIGHPSSRPDLTVAGAWDGMKMENYSEQLACFIGGNFILASTVLEITYSTVLISPNSVPMAIATLLQVSDQQNTVGIRPFSKQPTFPIKQPSMKMRVGSYRTTLRTIMDRLLRRLKAGTTRSKSLEISTGGM